MDGENKLETLMFYPLAAASGWWKSKTRVPQFSLALSGIDASKLLREVAMCLLFVP